MNSSKTPVPWAHLGLAPSAAEVVALRCPAPRLLAVGAHSLVAFLPAEAEDGVTVRAVCMRSGTCLWERLCAPASAGALVALRLSRCGRALFATCASTASVYVISALDGVPLAAHHAVRDTDDAPSAACNEPKPPFTAQVAGGMCRAWARSQAVHQLVLTYAEPQLDIQLAATNEGTSALATSPCGTVLLAAASIPRGCVLRRYRLRVSPHFSREAFRDLPLRLRLAVRELLLCVGASHLRHVDANTRAGIVDAICSALVAAVFEEQSAVLRSLAVVDTLRHSREAETLRHPGGLLGRHLARQLGDADPVPRARDCPRGLIMHHRALDVDAEA